jgi:hypothetical protein
MYAIARYRQGLVGKLGWVLAVNDVERKLNFSCLALVPTRLHRPLVPDAAANDLRGFACWHV